MIDIAITPQPEDQETWVSFYDLSTGNVLRTMYGMRSTVAANVPDGAGVVFERVDAATHYVNVDSKEVLIKSDEQIESERLEIERSYRKSGLSNAMRELEAKQLRSQRERDLGKSNEAEHRARLQAIEDEMEELRSAYNDLGE